MGWTTPRTWTTGMVVTAAQLNTDIRDNMRVGRGRQATQRTAGAVTVAFTTWQNVDTATDITIPADNNDYVEATADGTWGLENANGFMNVKVVGSGNTFGPGGSGDLGIVGLWGIDGIYGPFNATFPRQMVSGDVTGGSAQFRLIARTDGAAKTISATTAGPLTFFIKNVGPAV